MGLGELVCGVSLAFGEGGGGLGLCLLGASFSFLVRLFGGVWVDGIDGRSGVYTEGGGREKDMWFGFQEIPEHKQTSLVPGRVGVC